MGGVWRTIAVALRANVGPYVGPMGAASAATKKFGVDTDRVTKNAAARWTTFGKASAVGLTLLVAALIGSAREAISWESAFAGVEKTVDATASEFRVLESGLISLGNRLPATRTEIAGVAEAAGQLGIDNPYLLSFTETMIGLGEATNLASQEAATELARLANITQMPQTEFDRLGSSVVALGNNFATTEQEIVAMSMRIASAAHNVGMTEADITGLAATLSSVGIEAEAGGTAISRVIIKIAAAVDEGGARLGMFANAAGVSAEEFARSWDENPSQALVTFVQGLGKVEERGLSLFGVLDALGFRDVRVGNALRSMAGAGDLLAEALQTSNDAWEENTALTDEVEKRYATAESKLRVFRNQVTNVARVVGAEMVPVILGAVGAVQDLASTVADMASSVGLGQAFEVGTRQVAEHREQLMLAAAAWVAWTYGGSNAAAAVARWGTAFGSLEVRLAALSLRGAAGVFSLANAFGAAEVRLAALSSRVSGAIFSFTSLTASTGVLSATWTSFRAAVSSGMAGLGTAAAAAASAISVAKIAAVALNAAIMALPIALASFLPAISRAHQEADELVESLKPKDFDATSVESLMAYQQALGEARIAANENEDAQRSFWNTIDGASELLTPMENDILDAAIAAGDMDEAFRIATDAVDGLIAKYAAVGDALGTDRLAVQEWVKALEIDPSTMTVEDLTEALRSSVTGLASDAGVAGPAVGALMDEFDVEELEAKADALQDVQDAARDAWTAALDLLGAFPGALMQDEVAAGLAQLDADLDATLASISESFADTRAEIDDGFGSGMTDIGSGLTSALADIDESLSETVGDIEQDMARARASMSGDELSEALRRGEDQRAEAVEDAERRRADATEDAEGRRADATEDAEGRRADAAEENQRRIDDALAAGEEAQRKYREEHEITTADIERFYAESLWRATVFANNISTAIKQGYDPGLIARMIQAGPEEAGPELEALVSGHSARLEEMVNASEAAISEISSRAAKIARLTHMAVTSDTSRKADLLPDAIAIQQVLEELGGTASNVELADALDLDPGYVARIASEFEMVEVAVDEAGDKIRDMFEEAEHPATISVETDWDSIHASDRHLTFLARDRTVEIRTRVSGIVGFLDNSGHASPDATDRIRPAGTYGPMPKSKAMPITPPMPGAWTGSNGPSAGEIAREVARQVTASTLNASFHGVDSSTTDEVMRRLNREWARS